MEKSLKIVHDIAEIVNQHGGTAYFVGGYVRDSILQIPNKDIDIEILGVEESVLVDIIGNKYPIEKRGRSFPMYGILGTDIEIGLPRTEKKVEGDNTHTGFEITVNPYLTVKEACSRRDFTINAIYKNVLTGEIFDYFDGIKDIQNEIIRPLNENSLSEDSLRVFRGCQFAARFNFSLDKSFYDNYIDTSGLSVERVLVETEKALLKADIPSIYFTYLMDLTEKGVIDNIWFQPLFNLCELPQNQLYHHEADVYEHTMFVINEAAKIKKIIKDKTRFAFMLSALCHDFGKVNSLTIDENGIYHNYNHEKTGLPIIKEWLNFLKVSNSTREYVLNMVKLHQKFPAPNQKNFNKTAFESVSPAELIYLCHADGMGKMPQKEIDLKTHFDMLSVFEETIKETAVTGQFLIDNGFPPAPWFHEVLDNAINRQLKMVDKKSNQAQALAEARKLSRKADN